MPMQDHGIYYRTVVEFRLLLFRLTIGLKGFVGLIHFLFSVWDAKLEMFYILSK